MEDDVKVTFFPPLYEQRRSWVLSVLRKERVLDLLDIGCGEGSLLETLCYAPPYLTISPSFEAERLSLDSSTIEQMLQYINFELKIDRIAGLDISESDLQSCLEAVKPRKHESPVPGSGLLRWEKLQVEIYHGSLEDFNEQFVDVECIVATEVIEHLEPHALSSFTLNTLGRYRPQLLLVTTPSYVYNERFSAPDEVNPRGYKDPTGRTNRVFRHADHKFEWTLQEFTTWCSAEAEKYGYEVEISGVGRSLEPDPWGRDDELGYATQVAIFRRRVRENGEETGRTGKRRSPVRDGGPDGIFYEPSVVIQDQHRDVPAENTRVPHNFHGTKSHTLVAHYVHEAHPAATHPECDIEITNRVSSALRQYYTAGGWSIWELWVIEEISIACGGYIDVLLRAILNDGALTLDANREKYKSFTDWKVDFSNRELCQRLLAERASTRSEGAFGDHEESIQSESTSFTGEAEDPWDSTVYFDGDWSGHAVFLQTSDGLPEDDMGWGRQTVQDGWGT